MFKYYVQQEQGDINSRECSYSRYASNSMKANNGRELPPAGSQQQQGFNNGGDA
jgi:hypothetical protein